MKIYFRFLCVNVFIERYNRKDIENMNQYNTATTRLLHANHFMISIVIMVILVLGGVGTYVILLEGTDHHGTFFLHRVSRLIEEIV